MKIRKGDIIKHKDTMDICFEVLAIYEGSDSFKIKCWLINQGFNNSWLMDYKTKRIAIKKDNVKDLLYTRETIPCYRKADWKTYV